VGRPVTAAAEPPEGERRHAADEHDREGAGEHELHALAPRGGRRVAALALQTLLPAPRLLLLAASHALAAHASPATA
jgi:hypothetical protein